MGLSTWDAYLLDIQWGRAVKDEMRGRWFCSGFLLGGDLICKGVQGVSLHSILASLGR
jgi:hypothetical protein